MTEITNGAVRSSLTEAPGARDGGIKAWFRDQVKPRWRRNVFGQKTVSIFALKLAGYPYRYRRKRGYCDIVAIDAESLETYRDPEISAVRRLLQRWLQRGDHVLFAVKDGVVLGFIDLMTTTFRDREGLRMPIGEGECKMRDIRVFPAHRRTPALGVLHDAGMEFLVERGVHTVYGAVGLEHKVENAGTRGGQKALRSSKHLGYREVRRVSCYRVARWFRFSRDLWRAASIDDAREMTW